MTAAAPDSIGTLSPQERISGDFCLKFSLESILDPMLRFLPAVSVSDGARESATGHPSSESLRTRAPD